MKLEDYSFHRNLHIYNMKGMNLVLDVNSGAVHQLDEPAYLFLTSLAEHQGNWEKARQECLRRFPSDAVAATEAEIREAIEAGTLCSEEDDLSGFDYSSAVPKALCLNVAHACNMRCRYCFAGQGTYKAEELLMSRATARQAVDFLIKASQDRRHLEIDYFGGEPLLNLQVVMDNVDYARRRAAEAGKEVSLTLTTNCLNLDQQTREYLVDQGIAVILSLDGRPEVNDAMRLLPGGGSSYEKIMPNLRAMVESQPVSYYVRGTFTARNLDFSEDVRHLAELGFTNISLEPAVGGPGDIAIKDEHLPRILEEYERLTDLLVERRRAGRPIHFFHFDLDVNRGPCLPKRLTGCGAGVEYLAVTPEGHLYPCHQFIGQPGFKIGDVFQGIVNRDLVNKFASHNVTTKECRDCWARFFCGGGCHATAYFENGDLAVPGRLSCAMHRKRVECAIYLAVSEVTA